MAPPAAHAADVREVEAPRTQHLTVFAFLWACQALVHHEFYLGWLHAGDWAGWAVVVAALALLLRPGSLVFLAGLAVASSVYNVRKWPFVVNHILVETVINVTILITLLAVMIARRREGRGRAEATREEIYASFAPVVRAMLIVVYYFAILSKLNPDFLDPEVSCVSYMYEDLLRRLPFLTDGLATRRAAIAGTLAVELAIPVLLTFRRTWRWALAVGLPFHLMLGSIGHRTFSAIAFALYGLFAMEQLVPHLDRWRAQLVRRVGAERVVHLRRGAGIVVVLGVAALIGASASGHYRAGLGPLRVYRIPWLVWGAWSLVLMTAYALALRRPAAVVAQRGRTRPWLHGMTALVVLNGLSPYVGLKTETAFTMYSNLRTEAGRANHFFMPALRLADYQDDLVEVLDTDHPELRRHSDEGLMFTWFEFHRIASTTTADFHVRYRHNGGEPREFRRVNGQASDPALATPQPLLVRKLLFFRPVSLAERMPCLH